MKKNVLFVALLASVLASAQVGINTPTPNSNAVLDVVSPNKGLLTPRIALTSTTSAAPLSAHVAGMVIYNTATAGTAPSNVVPGLYYNDGTQWIPSKAGSSDNLYTADGTLAGNRTVIQNASTLAFNGTAVNAFSVDGTTLSVDAANNRVGIGTVAPTDALSVSEPGTSSVSVVSILQPNLADGNASYLKLGKSKSPNNLADISFYNAGNSSVNNRLDFGFNSASIKMTVKADGNIGIGTIAPIANLDIVGNTIGVKNGAAGGSWDNIWFNAGANNSSVNASGAEQGLQFNVGSNISGTYGDAGQTLTTVATMLPNGNMGIGTATPSSKAILDVSASNKGVLIPRMSTAQRIAIAPAGTDTGLQVYDMTTKTFWYWDGSSWIQGSGGSSGVTSVAGTAPITVATTAGTSTVSLNDAGVTTAKLSDNSVTSAKITDATIVNADLANGTGGIYKGDGALSGATTVTLGTNTLAFNGSEVNALSVDRTTFSVDAANDRVGIGTTAPTVKLEVTSGTANTSGLKLTNLTAASPTGTGQALGVDASGNIITVAAPAAATITGTAPIAVTTAGGTSTIVLSDLGVTTAKLADNAVTSAKITDGTVANVDIADGTGGIYKGSGSLMGATTVTQGSNTLTFSGTSVNSFSVDGGTVSVDAANDRLGIGTIAPTAKLDVVGTSMGIKNGSGSGSWDNLWFNVTPSIPSINASGAESGLQFNVGTNISGTYGDGQTLKTVATMLANGNMGVGTTSPSTTLEVNDPITTTQKSQLNILQPNLAINNGTLIKLGKNLSVDRNAGEVEFVYTGDGSQNNRLDFGFHTWTFRPLSIRADGNIGIGTTSPSPNAVLDVTSTNKGFLPPRLSTAQRNGITSPEPGLTIYNTTTNCLEFWNGATWYGVCGPGTPPVGSVTALTCSSATFNPSAIIQGSSYSGTITVPYTGGNGGTYSAATISSTGITGLTATLQAGTLANGSGNITYNVTGTPSSTGNGTFAITLGGQSCSVNFTTTAPSPAVFTSVSCAGASTGSLVVGAAPSGVTKTIIVNVTATGTYTISATTNGVTFSGSGTFTTTGNQNVILSASGTPTTAGLNTFSPSGTTCTFDFFVNFNSQLANGFDQNSAACLNNATIAQFDSNYQVSGAYTGFVPATTGGTFNIDIAGCNPGVDGAPYSGSRFAVLDQGDGINIDLKQLYNALQRIQLRVYVRRFPGVLPQRMAVGVSASAGSPGVFGNGLMTYDLNTLVADDGLWHPVDIDITPPPAGISFSHLTIWPGGTTQGSFMLDY